ncbi:hypothetical protein BX666DRAFT_1889891 [Dichotomocladium elegans]|nr:hypothetical protein BX666DRAFT_1889891 [Dichotomocladium elegans]
MLNRPNHVIQNQRHFQAPSAVPLWLKGRRDRLYAFVVFGAIGVGLTGSLWGTVKMAKGEK